MSLRDENKILDLSVRKNADENSRPLDLSVRGEDSPLNLRVREAVKRRSPVDHAAAGLPETKRTRHMRRPVPPLIP
jgi:hypothetical protein